jgi:hypothetical protein
VCVDDGLVDGAFVERRVGAVDGVLQHREGAVDVGDLSAEMFLLRSGPVAPVGVDVPVGIDEFRDLGECEAGDLEEVDQRNLLHGAGAVDALAAGASDRRDQSSAFVEAQRRRS